MSKFGQFDLSQGESQEVRERGWKKKRKKGEGGISRENTQLGEDV